MSTWGGMVNMIGKNKSYKNVYKLIRPILNSLNASFAYVHILFTFRFSCDLMPYNLPLLLCYVRWSWIPAFKLAPGKLNSLIYALITLYKLYYIDT